MRNLVLKYLNGKQYAATKALTILSRETLGSFRRLRGRGELHTCVSFREVLRWCVMSTNGMEYISADRVRHMACARIHAAKTESGNRRFSYIVQNRHRIIAAESHGDGATRLSFTQRMHTSRTVHFTIKPLFKTERAIMLSAQGANSDPRYSSHSAASIETSTITPGSMLIEVICLTISVLLLKSINLL